MIFNSNNNKQHSLSLDYTEKGHLKFIPICDFFQENDKLYVPGIRTIHVDFEKGTISKKPFKSPLKYQKKS